MKKRKGFVANSSTSSFICDVCGAEHAGMDVGLLDFDMGRCKRGHEFCNDHKTVLDTEKVALELVNEKYLNVDTKKELADIIASGDKDELSAIVEEILEDYYYGDLPESACPICTLVTFMDKDLLRFMLMRYHVSREIVEDTIRKQYNSYGEFFKATRNENKK